VKNEKPYVTGLEKFAEMVLGNLWNAVKKFYPAGVCQPVVISQLLISVFMAAFTHS